MTGRRASKGIIDPVATRMGQTLRNAALLIVLGVLAGRCFMNEAPFRRSEFSAASRQGPQGDYSEVFKADRAPAARVIFSVILLAAWAMWTMAGAIEGEIRIRHASLALLASAFLLVAAVSAWRASDQRAAWDGWLEQASLWATAMLVVQLAADRRKLAMVVVVLAGIGLAVGARAIWESAVDIPDRIARDPAWQGLPTTTTSLSATSHCATSPTGRSWVDTASLAMPSAMSSAARLVCPEIVWYMIRAFMCSTVAVPACLCKYRQHDRRQYPLTRIPGGGGNGALALRAGRTGQFELPRQAHLSPATTRELRMPFF